MGIALTLQTPGLYWVWWPVEIENMILRLGLASIKGVFVKQVTGILELCKLRQKINFHLRARQELKGGDFVYPLHL